MLMQQVGILLCAHGLECWLHTLFCKATASPRHTLDSLCKKLFGSVTPHEARRLGMYAQLLCAALQHYGVRSTASCSPAIITLLHSAGRALLCSSSATFEVQRAGFVSYFISKKIHIHIDRGIDSS